MHVVAKRIKDRMSGILSVCGYRAGEKIFKSFTFYPYQTHLADQPNPISHHTKLQFYVIIGSYEAVLTQNISDSTLCDENEQW